ncbi:MAG: hypothetical protein HN736_04185 [Anaerolineae bacterium]|jgi:hypothetical protein|nr:hypothetical protein [Anaerolineae bacterium]MBT4310425.1 hypothetical protein [Anaerolineae bacterium]MBT4842849.1 hypothetical protein [Anaerolineae bacterium]MBT6061085.1 hypothetical protein [Anaerolineae bacterium]MBT6321262.1 hypothetical protein [Anaerolineae bacterium]
MIIHQPEIIVDNGMITLSSPIEFSNQIANIPKTLWFSFPEEYEQYISLRIEAFLLGMLIPAMYYQEDIEVRGPVSPKLAYNLREIMHIYHKAFELSPINIRYQSLEVFQPKQKPFGVMNSFSGGADSMYTLYSHLKENEPILEAQITHSLFIHGFNDFDVALDDQVYFNRLHKSYLDLFGELGVNLIVAKSNAYFFSKFRISWDYGYLPTQISFVCLLGNLVKRFYHPADGDYIEFNIPDLYTLSVPLYSTETLDVINHTTRTTRLQKIEAISEWQHAHENLRVCQKWDKQDVEINCGKCYKCLTTMMLIEMIGSYEKFTTFEQPYPRNSIIRYLLLPNTDAYSYLTFKTSAKKFNRIDFLFWIFLFNIPILIKSWLIEQLQKRMTDETKYRLRSILFGSRSIDNSKN